MVPETELRRCLVCRTPIEPGPGGEPNKYDPWCSRGCQANGKRKTPADPDVVARRMIHMESREIRRLTTEIDALLASQKQRNIADTERDLKMALMQEEIDVLRWYGNSDCTRLADAELERRRRDGRSLDNVGAEAVITAERRRTLAKLA
jgi:hypothetical protein